MTNLTKENSITSEQIVAFAGASRNPDEQSPLEAVYRKIAQFPNATPEAQLAAINTVIEITNSPFYNG